MVLGVLLGGAAMAACTSDDDVTPPPGGLDASIPLPDANPGHIDGSVGADASHDAAQDTGIDATTADTSVPDTGTPDTAVPDAETDAGTDAADAAPPFDGGPCALPDGGVASTCDEILVDVTNGGSSAVTSYTVQFVVDTRPFVSAGKVQSDFSDFAPYGADHQTLLPFWVASGECNAAATRIFVQIASLAAGATTRVYLTYGASPKVAQSPTTLFSFFDDFAGTTLDTAKWIHYGDGTYTVANGLLTTQHANLLQSASNVVSSGTTAIGVREDGNSALGDDFEIGAGTIATVSSPSWLWVQARTGHWASLVSYSALNMLVSGGSTFCTNDNVGPTALFDGKTNDVEMSYDLGTGVVSARWTTSETGAVGTHSSFSDAGCLPASNGGILLGLDHGTGTGSDPITHVDWVYTRNVVSPEPTLKVTTPAWTVDAGASDAATD
jgi:hypothetical protein